MHVISPPQAAHCLLPLVLSPAGNPVLSLSKSGGRFEVSVGTGRISCGREGGREGGRFQVSAGSEPLGMSVARGKVSGKSETV